VSQVSSTRNWHQPAIGELSWLDILQRVALALALSIFVWRAWHRYLASHQLYLLLLIGSETLTAVLVLIARPPKEYDARLYAVALTLVGTFYFLLVKLSPGPRLVPREIGVGLQILGLSFQVAGKLWLGRRFGLLPANRGIVTTGPYRLVRHPIYTGYFLNHLGFLASAFSVRNLLLYTILYTVQIGRMLEEEKILRRDPGYQRYTEKVRYRMLPLVF
jgi:protein-S-isoprenylcysteine O-methyltransferase Ste14